jgi:hypothetical protein
MAQKDRIKELKEIQDGLDYDAIRMTPEILAKRLARVIELMLQEWADQPDELIFRDEDGRPTAVLDLSRLT